MPRVTKRLTHAEVDRSKSKDKDYTLQDGDGLYLLIKANGSKSWRFNYYRPGSTPKKRALLSFGLYPDVTLAAAREKREQARSLVASGIDPQIRFKQLNDATQSKDYLLFTAVAKSWFDVKKTTVAAQHANNIWRSLEINLFPFIGSRNISDLKPRDFIVALEPVKFRGSLETLRRLIQRINEIMIYAINLGFIDINPASGISYAFAKPKKNHQPSIRPERLPDFLSALRTEHVSVQTQCLILWQLLTAVRPSEASSAEWSDIDIESMRWVIPPEKMKMKREHTVPLSSQAISILNFMHSISGHRQFVFPGFTNPNKPMSSQTANNAIKRIGFKGELVSHGLRSIASTAMNEAGFNPDVIEATLAHMDKDNVRRAYNRSVYLEQRVELMQWWGNFVERSYPADRLFW